MVGSEIRKAVKEASFPAWWTDPFARGAYSICDPGHETARDALARPVAARLFIAGEATAGGGAMTVGGATLAGRAAAAAALAQMKA
jgi:monoamine oxidase